MTRATFARGMAHGARASVVAITLLAMPFGCARHANFPTSDPHAEPAPRRAPGVVVVRHARWPTAAPRGSSDAGLLVLSEAPDLGIASRLVADFFRAVVNESPEQLGSLLSEKAWLDSNGARDSAQISWQKRFAEQDYAGLRGLPLYRENEVQVYSSTDLLAASEAPRVAERIHEGWLVVRVPLSVARVGRTRLFADQLTFVLEPRGAGYRIARMSEEFQDR